jgi:hypothetical protein
MPNLYPTFEPPTIVEQEQPQLAPEYPKSYLFDFEKGDFVLDGAGRMVIADGYTAWAQWCVKTILTERFAYLAYSRNYGVEIDEALKQPTRAAVETEVERTITEALLTDPRTYAVRDFSFEWRGDKLYVSFTVIPVIGEAVRIEGVKLSGV